MSMTDEQTTPHSSKLRNRAVYITASDQPSLPFRILLFFGSSILGG